MRDHPPGVRNLAEPTKGISPDAPFIVTSAAVALAFVGGTAYAYPKLVAASRPADAAVASTTRITLQCSEKLVPAFSKAELVMSAMPDMWRR